VWVGQTIGRSGSKVTDTALFRYRYYYHTPFDTSDRFDFEKMARVVGGVQQVIEDLVMDP
jgi:hypothetical protein